ncbi:MAG: helix-turn-helix transcriptional regulator [Clostridia bacterium]|nr:helix-turn-helix transcriptional regulator [Clostridia bacterium]
MIRELYQRVNSMLIGSRIRDARKAKGMSQTALAKHLNKTLRSVQKYETGEVEVSIAQLDIIADILGVSSKYLLGFNDRLVEVKSLEDVLYFIHDLSKKEELRFKIISKHPQFDGEWSTSIVFDATDDTGEHNRDIVSMLTSYRNQVSLMPYVYHPGKVMDDWVRREGPLYRGATLMNRPPEEICPPDDNAD